MINKSVDDEEAIEMLLRKILKHLHLDPSGVELYIVHSVFARGDRRGAGRAGTYQTVGSQKSEIEIIVKQGYTFWNIAAILCHECTHYYAEQKNLRMNDTSENEILTDILTVFLGFGRIMIKGYEDNDIGYLKSADIAYLKRNIHRLWRRSQRAAENAKHAQTTAKESKAGNDLENARKSVRAVLLKAEEKYTCVLKLSQAFAETRMQKVTGDWQAIQEMYLAIETNEIPAHIARISQAECKAEDISDLITAKEDAKSIERRLEKWRRMLEG